MNTRITLLLLQIYVHIMFVAGLFFFPPLTILISLILSHVIFVGLCGTVYYHRVMSHRNNINSVLEKILMFVSWIGASGSVLGWVATHRTHHRYSDTLKDPHSPKFNGLWKTYWWSSANEKSIRLVPDLLRNKLYVWQHKYYFVGIILLHIIMMVMFEPITYWLICIVPAFMMWFAGSMINVLSHDENGPANSLILGLLFAGEGWHKNHHDQASNPIFNNEYDLGAAIYKILPKG
jgi:stearoyl-CoA desaturase (delta-9 desaturase)